MATKRKKVTHRKETFPQTPLHKLVYTWLHIFERDGDLWDVLSSLRSCDVDDNNGNAVQLKRLTTERIRSVIGLSADILQSANQRVPGSNPKPLTKTDKQNRQAFLRDTSSHFKRHYMDAIYAIRRNTGYDLLNERIRKRD